MRPASCIEAAAPFVAMLVGEVVNVGVSTMSKAATETGLSSLLFVVYSNALATLILLPHFVFHRNERPPLTFRLLCRFFLLGLIGSLGQTIVYSGLKYSSPTLLSAMSNLIPIFTFTLAVIFRMEMLDLRECSSQAKLIGAIVSVSGAFIVTLYKGPPILMPSSISDLPHHLLLSQQPNWVLGGILFAITCLLSSVWNILQAATVKEYPQELTILFFFCFFVTFQCAIFTLVVERNNPNAWTLRPGIQMIAIAFSAIFGSGIRTALHIWVIHKKGPVYVAMFLPVGIIIAVLMSVIFLGDTLHLGSIIGSIIIAIGFYAVTWGKIKEKNLALENETCSLDSSNQKTPLLPSNCEEEI